MKTIYLIYECNAHREHDSVKIKWMTTAKSKAKAFYNTYKKDYEHDAEWSFNLGSYEQSHEECDENSNMLRDIELLKSTEEN